MRRSTISRPPSVLEQRGFEPPVPGAEAITKRNRVLREDCPPNQLTNAAALSDPGLRLSHGPGPSRLVSHRACRRALGSAPRGCGAAPRCRHDLGDRWDMPHKVLVGFCRWPGQEHARPSLGSGRRVTSRRLGCGCSWRPPSASRGNRGLCFCSRSRSWSPTRWCLANARQHAFGRLKIGQLSGDLFAVGIEARQPLAELHLFCGDLIHCRRCWGPHGDLQ